MRMSSLAFVFGGSMVAFLFLPAIHAQSTEGTGPTENHRVNSHLAAGPYTAHFRRTDRYPTSSTGTTQVTESKWARDSRGRTFNETRPLGVEWPRGFYMAQITDPVVRTTTSWNSFKRRR
jgi:hypothetical protein